MAREELKDQVKKIKVRVIGIGGGGVNIVSEIAQTLKGVSFLALDTDFKSLKSTPKIVEKLPFGKELTKGFGSGGDFQLAIKAAFKEKEKIKKIFENQDLVIFISCLGGGTGSGGSLVLSRLAKNLDCLTYGVFTLPFGFEGEKKMETAKDFLLKIRKYLNAVSVIPNEKISQVLGQKISFKKSLSEINKILAKNLQSLTEIIYKPGLINIDFADLKTVFEGRGKVCYLNSLEFEGENWQEEIEKLIHAPFFPYSVEGAKAVILKMAGIKTLSQMNQISKKITEKISSEAKIILGISSAEIPKVTILATGCKEEIFPKKSVSKTKPEGAKKVKIQKPKNKPAVIRKNGLEVKKEAKEAEKEILEKEKIWEKPTFLRIKFSKGQNFLGYGSSR